MHPLDQVLALPAFHDNYIWCWAAQGQLHVVDPGDAAPVRAHLEASGLSLGSILITHHHPDHVGGVAALRKLAPEAPVYGPAAGPFSDLSQPLREGDRIETGGAQFEILATPGHTLDHICYVHPNALFCGDTLFAAGCGRLFEGEPAQTQASLAKLAALPDSTPVYCAHEYTLANLRFAEAMHPEHAPTRERRVQVQAQRDKGAITLPSSIGLERKTNPFLRAGDPALQQALRAQGHRADDALSAFTSLRQAKDRF